MKTQPSREDLPCQFDDWPAVLRHCMAKRPTEARTAQYLRLLFARG
ncbi:hypothetical protein [Caenimonas sedimenti]|nr:hypothetical protein [Caenimonas sedimenti]